MNSIACETPLKQTTALSIELQRVIEERSLLTSRSRSKILKDLNDINNDGIENKRHSLQLRATQEILTSELSYVQQLETIMKFFMEPISLQGLMSPEQFSAVFGNVETVYRVAGALVKELQACEEDSLAPAFVRLAPFLKMYSLYACGYQKAINTLQSARQGRSGTPLHLFLQSQESRPEVACTLQSLLITPVQRLPRYRLLLREVSSHTSVLHPHQLTLQEALCGVEASASHVDALLSEQEQQNRLVELQQCLRGGWPQVLGPGRTLLREGSFMKVSKCGTRAVPVHLVLLTDMFLCCRGKTGALDCRYAFPLSRCGLETVLSQAVFKVLCGTETLLLFARNQEEGQLWMNSMKAAITELKSSRQTLRKENSRKRIPKRLEDLEENAIASSSGGLLARAFGKRRRLSQQPCSPQFKRPRNSRCVSASLASPPKDCLFPLREQRSLIAQDSISSTHLCLCLPGSKALPKKRISQIKERLNLHSGEQIEKVNLPPSGDVPLTSDDSKAHINITCQTSEEAQNLNWTTHCINLVRRVSQCIKSTFMKM